MNTDRKLYKKYLDLAKEQFNKSDSSKQSSKYISEHRKVYLINCLILIELALESFVNDFGYTYVINYEYLERISIKNRLIILPKISKYHSKEILHEKDNLYQRLNSLIKYRNIFVHRDAEERLDKAFDRVSHELVNDFYKATIELFRLYNKSFNIFKDDNFLNNIDQSWL